MTLLNPTTSTHTPATRPSAVENQVVTMLKAVTTEDMLMPDVSRVLIIYTGGTIGMKNTDQGYVPVPNYLSEQLSRVDRFHDPTGWNQGLNLSRSSSANSLADIATRTPNPPVTITSSPSVSAFPSTENLERQAVEAFTMSPWLITPKSLYGKRIQYRILEYSPLLDSCNMTMAHWIQIATDIETYYAHVDAFIILHGTDTMAYTASALSFLLEDLGKPVILTGSQVPISEVRNDAVENLLGALTIAGHFVIPEVCLYFSNTLYRGNRTSKMDAMNFNAFESPNFSPLVKVGVDIKVNWSDIVRPTALSRFQAHKVMNPNVATLRLFPGITVAAIRAFLTPPIAGIVLETYGAGNAPNARQDLVAALKEASDRGVVIVNCSQCKKGLVSDLYATSKPLREANVVPGRDMTAECALTKLSYLLGKNYTPEECRVLMGKNLRGELTTSDPLHGVGFHNRVHHFLQILATTVFSNQRSLVNSSPLASFTVGEDHQGEGYSPTHPLLMPLQYLSGATTAGESKNSPHLSPVLREVTQDEQMAIEKTFFPILICAAAAIGDIEGLRTLQRLLGARFQLNCVDYDGRTPLHLAASEGRVEACDFLLRNGASVHVLDHFGHTPLYDAIRKRSERCVRMLVRAGALFNERENREVAFQFIHAAAQGDVDLLKLYGLTDIDVNKPGLEGRTALHLAVSYAQVDVVRSLVSMVQIRCDVTDRWGRTPLEDAQTAYQMTLIKEKGDTNHRKCVALRTIVSLLKDTLPNV
ncbi:hypothetical protein IWQ61_005404 [Dispira simplex]|nr:hypothetical protein IWQ61_005404 [Dispira simplex]